ncbi:hypothetical protein MBM_00750 [Drepanopeziza brunnea f. sp. 'multigermtubi' MB_m1]|uniref:Uncharacterized protein n=2 Tax=Drepanopeziza brunnea f. sp. 'multigermtubi' TaxID=698441 RepID=K1X9J5_MARBU|nr:uncharacterized protein MBM_00750 [Drepanopeziza brunnea f. sp. 'multigermtubi' MB_m1]EKD21637.1 hypothetical protein MBM_00750 [Drepanopeziza brunnea f. sp. 'multigermtubi' MB_m1]
MLSGLEVEAGLKSGYGSKPDIESGKAPEPQSEEPEPESGEHLRWLHAGLYKDAKGATKDVWFAFRRSRKTESHTIAYASDGHGSPFGNRNGGRRKSDLITWDPHHAKKWEKFIAASGTWTLANILRGRKLQRETLLATWLDPNSPNTYAHGRDHNRTLNPPLNVVHTIDDASGPGSATSRAQADSARARRRNRDLAPEECYAGTKIPLSAVDIRVGAFLAVDPSPRKVVATFLNGQLATNPRLRLRKEERNDAIESAFLELGWRISRPALERANDKVAAGKIDSIFHCRAWNKLPPLLVDKYKGDSLAEMMDEMREQAMEYGGIEESDDEERAQPSSDADSDSDSDRDESDNTEESSPFVSQKSERSTTITTTTSTGKDPSTTTGRKDAPNQGASWRSRKLSAVERMVIQSQVAHGDEPEDPPAQPSRDTGDDFEYLPDASPSKGKGPAKRKRDVDLIPEPAKSAADNNNKNNSLIVDGEGATLFPSKRLKTPEPKPKPEPEKTPSIKQPAPLVIIDLDPDSDDDDHDSDIEIDEARSCAPAVKPESGVDLKYHLALEGDDEVFVPS